MPENKFRTRLIDQLAPKSGETILEFGYGTAQNLIKIHQQNPNVKLSGTFSIGDWEKAKSIRMRLAFYLVQIVDGFKTTADNLNGLLPSYMSSAGFKNVTETGFINTKLGSYCYYQAEK
ncbi:hypothetical protein [Pedobacter sp. NJ-S-72]